MFEDCRILVIGDVMLDRYWLGPTDHLSPEAPVPVVNVEDTQARPGGAANVAWNLAGLGAAVRLVGVVGDDPAARELTMLTDELGIDNDLIVDKRVTTTVKQRVISRNQQLIRLDFGTDPATLAAVTHDRVLERATLAMTEHRIDAVVCSDYAKGALAGVGKIIACARQNGILVVIDPKRADWTAYHGADVVTPNAAELAAASQADTSTDEGVVRAAEDMRRRHAIGALVVTRSQRGMTLIAKQDEIQHLPARAREVFDVTGAGDTVTALLAAGLARGEALATAAERANRGAGAVVGRLGTAVPSAAELMDPNTPDSGADRNEARLAWVQAEKAAGARIVFTNGCFDLLHAGHVDLLHRARALGDRLIVAVNDDASVARLKGAARPIQNAATRMAVLNALADVDCVLCFAEDTPAALIERIRPDVLVKGGDYQPDTVVGGESVRRHGGRVEILEHLPGFSTTMILNRLHNVDEAR